MYVLKVRNLNDAFIKLGYLLMREGKSVGTRSMNTLELHPVLLEVAYPRERFLSINSRGNNPFQTVYETLWVFSGRNDIEALSYYMRRAKDFSDNGKTWRGGYGPRLFVWHMPFSHVQDQQVKINQIDEVIKCLEGDLSSRQAVVEIWDPGLDTIRTKTKDRPCTNYLHFMHRDGKLDMLVVMRSNDLLWGFSAINFFEWSWLQDFIAGWFATIPGKMYYLADSLHIYRNVYYEKLVNCLYRQQIDIYADAGIRDYIIHHGLNTNLNPGHLPEIVRPLTELIDLINQGEYKTVCPPTSIEDNEWLANAFFMLVGYHFLMENEWDKCVEQFKKITIPDMLIVALEYLVRGTALESWDRKNILDIAANFPVARKFIENSMTLKR